MQLGAGGQEQLTDEGDVGGDQENEDVDEDGAVSGGQEDEDVDEDGAEEENNTHGDAVETGAVKSSRTGDARGRLDASSPVARPNTMVASRNTPRADGAVHLGKRYRDSDGRGAVPPRGTRRKPARRAAREAVGWKLGMNVVWEGGTDATPAVAATSVPRVGRPLLVGPRCSSCRPARARGSGARVV